MEEYREEVVERGEVDDDKIAADDESQAHQVNSFAII